VLHFITGGKEGNISVRSQAALETGRPPGFPHPSMRQAPEIDEAKSTSGDTTIMQGFVLLDEIPPARQGDPNATTAHGIASDESVRGAEPVEDGEKTRVGLPSDLTVRGAEAVTDTAPLTKSHADPAAFAQAAQVPGEVTASGRMVVGEEDLDDIVDLDKTATESTASGRHMVEEPETSPHEDSSIAIPAERLAVEPAALEPEPPANPPALSPEPKSLEPES
jgi:hypothetical protein